jgi:anti-anti-sigma regulatory factor
VGQPRPLAEPLGLGPGDHAAWTLEGGEYAAAVTSYFTEGVARGERLVLVNGHGEGCLDLLGDLPERDRLLEHGQLVLPPPEETYGRLLDHDIWQQVEHVERLAALALDAGYAGLRVWADITPLTQDPQTLQRYLDYDVAIEAAFTHCPVTGLCALEASRPQPQWTRLASRHRLRRETLDSPPMAVSMYNSEARLVGEVDLSCHDELVDALSSVARATRGRLTMDLAELEFLDVGGARVLARFVAELADVGRPVDLVGAGRLTARLLTLFGVPTPPVAGAPADEPADLSSGLLSGGDGSGPAAPAEEPAP